MTWHFAFCIKTDTQKHSNLLIIMTASFRNSFVPHCLKHYHSVILAIISTVCNWYNSTCSIVVFVYFIYRGIFFVLDCILFFGFIMYVLIQSLAATRSKPLITMLLCCVLYRCNLASVVLQLLAMGISNVVDFDFMDRPSAEVSCSLHLCQSADRHLRC